MTLFSFFKYKKKELDRFRYLPRERRTNKKTLRCKFCILPLWERGWGRNSVRIENVWVVVIRLRCLMAAGFLPWPYRARREHETHPPRLVFPSDSHPYCMFASTAVTRKVFSGVLSPRLTSPCVYFTTYPLNGHTTEVFCNVIFVPCLNGVKRLGGGDEGVVLLY